MTKDHEWKTVDTGEARFPLWVCKNCGGLEGYAPDECMLFELIETKARLKSLEAVFRKDY